MPTFLTDPDLAEGAVVDDGAHPGPAFIFLSKDFLTPWAFISC
jgi:hypothetical protein